MKANGGIISKQDLAEYQAKVRTPVRGRYRGHDIISMPPPSSGGIVIVEALNILEPFDLRSRGRYNATTTHLIIEAMRRAFLDRARYTADPDFVDVPVKRLTSTAYADELRTGLDTLRASSSVALGRDIVTDTVTTESNETTHFSVVDGEGMAVSNTYTLEQWYGSSVVVPGTGILLNNEMGDFNKRPGFTSVKGDIGTKPNLIEPGKRMLSSMTPTIVRRDGKVLLVTGSPGGRTIPNTVLNIVLNVVEFGMGARGGGAPRLHMQWLPDTVTLEDGAMPELVAKLKGPGLCDWGDQRAGGREFDWRGRRRHGLGSGRQADRMESLPAGAGLTSAAPKSFPCRCFGRARITAPPLLLRRAGRVAPLNL